MAARSLLTTRMTSENRPGSVLSLDLNRAAPTSEKGFSAVTLLASMVYGRANEKDLVAILASSLVIATLCRPRS